jgi:hypothetical protein
MKLEVGKYYKLVGGWKLKIVYEDKFGKMLGVYDNDGNGSRSLWYNKDGSAVVAYSNSSLKVASEWVEPVTHKYEMALLKMIGTDGRHFISLQNISSIAPWDNSSIIARKTIEITEGEGL